MKKIITIILSVAMAALALSSCQKVNLDGADLKTLSLSYDTDGNVLPTVDADGAVIEKSVVINQGSINRDVEWTVAVDNQPDWVSVEKTSVVRHFTGTYGGDEADVTFQAVKITVQANNTGLKRTAVIRFSVADGSTISTTLKQNK